jgi:hypothetical protein
MRKTVMFAGVSVVLIVVASSAMAATMRHVPGDYATIQEAIDAANQAPPGDEVVIAPGTYQECIEIDKAIKVRSADPMNPAVAGKTILKPAPGSTEPVVTITSGAYQNYTKLTGVTITGCGSDVGAVVCSDGSCADVTWCIIASNSGPGVRRQPGSHGGVVRCIVRNNGGNGVESWYCAGFINYCTIFNNQGAGVWFTGPMQAGLGAPATQKHLRVSYCTIYGNDAGSALGGGVLCTQGANPEVIGCTIVRNKAGQGAGVVSVDGEPSLWNCIIAFNEGNGVQALPDDAMGIISYCNVFGHPSSINYAGVDDPTGEHGNISEDPLFGDAAHSDYHLKSAAGRWQRGSWVNDGVTSPCIDAGDTVIGVGDEPTPNGGRRNMGSYGGTEHASKSPLTRAPRGGRGGR